MGASLPVDGTAAHERRCKTGRSVERVDFAEECDYVRWALRAQPMGASNVVVRRAEARVVPWKNGLGTTTELAVWPVGATMGRLDFDWRISAATVGAAGPFSEFRGYERILTITSGAGLRVDHGGHAPMADLRPLEPYRFSGEWPTAAELVGGPVEDFNVIFRRGKVHAEVEAIHLDNRGGGQRRGLSVPHSFLHVVSGTLRVVVNGGEHAVSLEAGDSFWRRDAESTELEMVAQGSPAAALLVSLR